MTTPNASTHLSETERQGLADGTLAAEHIDPARTHIAVCTACAADVARLAALMTRIRQSSPVALGGDDLWPGIRSRIDRSKVVPLNPRARDATPRLPRPRRWIGVAAVAASAFIVFAVAIGRRDGTKAPSATAADTAGFINVADSSHAYEEEARTLMNELEMRRSMLRPQTASSIDGDLRTIDDAISETKQALVADPNNVALRRMLASSYRQKVELLKRANNAG